VRLGLNLLDGEQERARTVDNYMVHFADDKDIYDYTPMSESAFKRFDVGKKFLIRVGVVTGVEVIGE